MWAVGLFIHALVLNSSRQTSWRLAGESCGTTNIVISSVAYSCTNQQKTGSNISLFSGNLCCKCLCCVSVYVNECNSFENVHKYQCIKDTFVFLGGAYIKCFPVVTLIGFNIKCYRGRIQFYK